MGSTTVRMVLAMMAVTAAQWMCAAGYMIIVDNRKFMRELMEQDQRWMPYLNVAVKVDTTMLAEAARNLLIGVNSGQLTPAADQTVTVNALDVIADVVSVHYEEGNAFDFGMSVIASAVRCTVLKDISLQLRAVSEYPALQEGDDDERSTWIDNTWTNLTNYMDRLARLKEQLASETQMYNMWMTALLDTTPHNAPGETPAQSATVRIGDLTPMRTFVHQILESECVPSTADANGATERFGQGTEDWTTSAGIKEIMARSQERLDRIFDELTFSTMEIDQWFDVLNVNAFKDQIVDSHSKCTHAEGQEADQWIMVDKPAA